jgi:hypothetical protein
MIRNLLPRTHWTTYDHDGHQRLAIWRQWRSHVWSHVEVRVG